MNKFEIFSISAGWINGVIRDNKKEYFFDYSYLTNFIDDLMKALLYVNKEWAEDEKVFIFDTECEPVIDVWTLSMEDQKLSINIKTFEDDTKQKLEGEIVLEYNSYEFVQAFISGIKDMLGKYGLLGYRDAWEFEFPTSLFLQLIDLHTDQNLVQLVLLGEEDNVGIEIKGSSFNNECKILKEISEDRVKEEVFK